MIIVRRPKWWICLDSEHLSAVYTTVPHSAMKHRDPVAQTKESNALLALDNKADGCKMRTSIKGWKLGI